MMKKMKRKKKKVKENNERKGDMGEHHIVTKGMKRGANCLTQNQSKRSKKIKEETKKFDIYKNTFFDKAYNYILKATSDH